MVYHHLHSWIVHSQFTIVLDLCSDLQIWRQIGNIYTLFIDNIHDNEIHYVHDIGIRKLKNWSNKCFIVFLGIIRQEYNRYWNLLMRFNTDYLLWQTLILELHYWLVISNFYFFIVDHCIICCWYKLHYLLLIIFISEAIFNSLLFCNWYFTPLSNVKLLSFGAGAFLKLFSLIMLLASTSLTPADVSFLHFHKYCVNISYKIRRCGMIAIETTLHKKTSNTEINN